MTRSELVFVGVLTATAACGARTSLETTDDGGTTSATSSGAGDTGAGNTGAGDTGAGGTGGTGATGPCSAVALPARSFDLPAGQTGRSPRLVASGSGGERVTLLTIATQTPLPLDAHPELRQVTFDDGWDDWPDAPLGLARLVGPALSYVAPHQPGDGLTLWVSAATQATGEQAYFVRNADPLDESPPANVLLGFAPPLGHVTVPTSVTSSVGYQQVSQTVLGLATTGGLLPVTTGHCPQPPPSPGVSDAIVVDDRFLIAAAAPELAGCGAPTTVRLLQQEPTTVPVEIASYSLDGLLSHLWLRERPGGAWLFAVLPASTSITLWAAPVDAMAQLTAMPMAIALPLLFEPSTLTVTSLGDGFAYAVLTSDSGEVDAIEVRSFDESGAPLLEWSLTPTATPRPDEPLGLLSGPDGEISMVAWSSDTAEPGVTGNAQVYASRLDCR